MPNKDYTIILRLIIYVMGKAVDKLEIIKIKM